MRAGRQALQAQPDTHTTPQVTQLTSFCTDHQQETQFTWGGGCLVVIFLPCLTQKI